MPQTDSTLCMNMCNFETICYYSVDAGGHDYLRKLPYPSRWPVLHRESEWEGGMKNQMALAVSLKAVIVKLRTVVIEIQTEVLRAFSRCHAAFTSRLTPLKL